MSNHQPQTPTLTVGIAGGGAIFRNHLEAYRALPDVEVVALCDIDAERAAVVATEHGIPQSFGSVGELLAWRGADGRGVDVLSVCTPHPTHESVVTEAAAAGVHVLCEKPIAIDVGAAERMVQVCRDAGVTFGVLFQRRFWPAAQRIRAAIDDGTLGQPILGHCSVLLHRESEYYSATPWRGTWDADGGGVLMTQGIHYIDLLQWFMGEVVEVSGHAATFIHGEHMETEDSAVATLRFASGALATLQASTAVTPSLGVQVRVTGSTGASAQLTEFPEGTDGRVDIWAYGDSVGATETWPAALLPNADLATINGALIPWHQAQVADFVDAVRTGRSPAVTGEEATKSLRILLAVYESSRTGQPVRF
ncbi:Gfo/Idh/MocA family oxidoreductase [Micrococcus terreus]|uniref:Gfo/Idh/MocA family protein n=1 Tax=Micrococcus terreus TaxID=574650 RepID=UPI0033E9EF85